MCFHFSSFRRSVVPLLLLAGAGSVPVRAAAQQDTAVVLAPIVVTAHRRPTSREVVTSRVTVISGDALRAQGITQLVDALRTVPGLSVVQTGSFGSVTSLFMRGGESDYVQVLVDGVPVNEPGGAYDFAHLTVDNIERIEILRGPASVVYGSDAVTGVVQIFTRRGAGPPRVTAGARGGTYGSGDFEAAVTGGSEQAGYSLGVSHLRSNGIYAFNNGYRNTTASGRFHYTPDERTDLNFTLRYTDAEFHFPTDGAGNLVDSNQFTANEVTTLGIDVGRYFTDRIQGRLHLALNDIGSLFDDEQDGPADTVGFFAFRSQTELRTRSADARVNVYLTPAAVVTGGASIEQERQRTDKDRTRLNRAYYAQVVVGPLSGLSANAGLRLDDNEQFGTFVTFRAGTGYRMTATGTRITASVGTGFKEPTFFETFDGAFSVGNPDLEPERSTSWEVGLEQPLAGGRVVLAGTYFDQRFEDLIQFTFSPPGPGDPNYFNVAEATARGIEAEVRAVPVRGLQLSASYTYLSTEVTDSGFNAGPDAAFVVGDRLLRRPTHAFTTGAVYRFEDRATLGATVRYIGDRDDLEFPGFPAPPSRVALQAHTVVDLSLLVSLLRPRGPAPGLALTARVENVLDEDYQEIVGFRARGRTVWLGGTLEY